jgi:hypothetical protein
MGKMIRQPMGEGKADSMTTNRLAGKKRAVAWRRSATALGIAGMLATASALTSWLASDTPPSPHLAGQHTVGAQSTHGADRTGDHYRERWHGAYLSSSDDRYAGDPGNPPGNQVGLDVAISGNTAVVAAPGQNKAGAAFIYERAAKGKPWRLIKPLLDPRGAADDFYAWAVAISSTKAGTYVAVGGNDNNGLPDFINIYKGSGTTWHKQATIKDPGPSWQDMFGDSLAISSDVLVIGASCNNDDSGETYISVHGADGWHMVGSIADPLDRASDFFGQSVAVSGNRVLIGALDRAYVYAISGDQVLQQAIINNPGPSSNNFGNSVALQGTTALIGAPDGILYAPNQPPLGPGAAFVYTLKGKSWVRRAKLVAPANAKGDEFGFSVAISGADSVIGQPVFGANKCGTAFAFAGSGATWKERAQLVNHTCTGFDAFGYSVAVSGTSSVIGAPGTNDQAGAFYVRTIP